MKKSTSNILAIDTKLKRIIIYLMKPFANGFILFNPKNRAKKNRVNLNYYNNDNDPNLGDAISIDVVKYMLKLKNIDLEKQVNKTKHLYAVGSIITAGVQDCTIWGSGILYTLFRNRIINRDLDIRAVRGPLTRTVLMEYGYDVPEIYGDPAIIMPEIYYPKNIKKTHKYGLIIHKNGSQIFDNLDNLDGSYKFIDIKTKNYKKFIDDLLSTECIISSSLHGIILAESYGIPAILVQPQYSLFKYYDWYMSTGRAEFPICKSLDEIKNIKVPDVPNLSELREGIKRAFPYDIFE